MFGDRGRRGMSDGMQGRVQVSTTGRQLLASDDADSVFEHRSGMRSEIDPDANLWDYGHPTASRCWSTKKKGRKSNKSMIDDARDRPRADMLFRPLRHFESRKRIGTKSTTSHQYPYSA